MKKKVNKVVITEKTPIWSKINDPKVISNYLQYEYEFWRDTPYGKERIMGRGRLVSKEGYFLTGFLKRVFNFLKENNIDYENKCEIDWDKDIVVNDPKIKNIKYRKWQQKALQVFDHCYRGVWQAPTGSGKTILFCGIIKMYNLPSLVIVHTESLFNQTYEVLQEFFGNVGRIGCGFNDEENISVAMIQTLSRKRNFNWGKWGVVVTDEAHHLNKISGTYAKTLMKIPAPVRIGVTATMPTTSEGKMVLEGIIGPKLGQTTYEELIEEGAMAKPVIKIYETPEMIYDKKKLKGGYTIIYDELIVNNELRNKLIVEKTKELVDQGRTCLVMVERVRHGIKLLRLLEKKLSGVFTFLHGETPTVTKEKERQDFKAKKRKGIIATRVWSEGIDIKTVGAVVNAIGGESEIATIQRFGRGLRVAEGKVDVVLVDFFDANSHWWFIKHSGKRICSYIKFGWL